MIRPYTASGGIMKDGIGRKEYRDYDAHDVT